jgi:hypothetical protein
LPLPLHQPCCSLDVIIMGRHHQHLTYGPYPPGCNHQAPTAH